MSTIPSADLAVTAFSSIETASIVNGLGMKTKEPLLSKAAPINNTDGFDLQQSMMLKQANAR